MSDPLTVDPATPAERDFFERFAAMIAQDEMPPAHLIGELMMTIMGLRVRGLKNSDAAAIELADKMARDLAGPLGDLHDFTERRRLQR